MRHFLPHNPVKKSLLKSRAKRAKKFRCNLLPAFFLKACRGQGVGDNGSLRKPQPRERFTHHKSRVNQQSDAIFSAAYRNYISSSSNSTAFFQYILSFSLSVTESLETSAFSLSGLLQGKSLPKRIRSAPCFFTISPKSFSSI